MKKNLLTALIILIIAQLCIPFYMMANHFYTLNTGTEYKFRVKPVDPYDAFRGRYVSINVEGPNFGASDKSQTVYVTLKTDSEGFSTVNKTYNYKPQNTDYIKAKTIYGRVSLPFKRYYMDENFAQNAETAYERQTKDAYIKVKVKNGNAITEGLYIDNIPIEDYVKQKD